MTTITVFTPSRLNNPEFNTFIENVLNRLKASEVEKLGLSAELVAEMEALHQKIVDQVYIAQGSQFTQDMIAADAKRDLAFKRCRHKLQAVEYAEEGTPLAALAPNVTVNLLNRYGNSITQKAQQEETAMLAGFILDCRNKLSADDLKLLDLSEALDALEAANTAFSASYQSRTGERAEGDTGVTKKLRDSLTEIYTKVCLAVQFHANGTDATKADACSEFIRFVNVIIADVKRRLVQRGVAAPSEDDGSGSEESGSGSGTTGSGAAGSGSGSGSGSGTTGTGSGSGSGTTGSGSTGSGSGSTGSGSGSSSTGGGSGDVIEWD